VLKAVRNETSSRPTIRRFFPFIVTFELSTSKRPKSRSQWLRGLRQRAYWDCGFESQREAWISVCCECCVLSDRGLSVGLITRQGESYRLWCVWVLWWSLNNEEALAPLGAVEPQTNKQTNKQTNTQTCKLFNTTFLMALKTEVQRDFNAVKVTFR
jgi:hypothetical protein